MDDTEQLLIHNNNNIVDGVTTSNYIRSKK